MVITLPHANQRSRHTVDHVLKFIGRSLVLVPQSPADMATLFFYHSVFVARGVVPEIAMSIPSDTTARILLVVTNRDDVVEAEVHAYLCLCESGESPPWPQPINNTAKQVVTQMLRHIGEDVDRPGLADTPMRVAKSWSEIYAGYHKTDADMEKEITTFPDIPADEMISLYDIEMYSTCEHHMQPFVGVAHIAYIPKGKVVGISKLARVLEHYARRLQVQERIGEQVVGFLDKVLEPKGVACVIEAKHFCMCSRGVNKQNSRMRTSALRGAFRDDPATRAEFLNGIR